jgi:hypothetical protein
MSQEVWEANNKINRLWCGYTLLLVEVNNRRGGRSGVPTSQQTHFEFNEKKNRLIFILGTLMHLKVENRYTWQGRARYWQFFCFEGNDLQPQSITKPFLPDFYNLNQLSQLSEQNKEIDFIQESWNSYNNEKMEVKKTTD